MFNQVSKWAVTAAAFKYLLSEDQQGGCETALQSSDEPPLVYEQAASINGYIETLTDFSSNLRAVPVDTGVVKISDTLRSGLFYADSVDVALEQLYLAEWRGSSEEIWDEISWHEI